MNYFGLFLSLRVRGDELLFKTRSSLVWEVRLIVLRGQ